MTAVLKSWLKQQLEALVSVRRCSLSAETSVALRERRPDVTVHMWTGVLVHIYLLEEPLKTRTIKNLVQLDTQHGIGSLFIVDPDILPAPNTVLTPDEWMMALHGFADERIFTYTQAQNGIRTVHFDQIGVSDDYSVLYSATLTCIRQFTYTRVTVKQRALKGFWIVADFGSDSFWKKNPIRPAFADMPRPRWNYQHPRQTPSAAHQHNAQPAAPRPKSKVELAYEQLGIAPDATRDDVRTAFRKLAFDFHPDVSSLEKTEAEARFKALTEAYETIKAANEWV